MEKNNCHSFRKRIVLFAVVLLSSLFSSNYHSAKSDGISVNAHVPEAGPIPDPNGNNDAIRRITELTPLALFSQACGVVCANYKNPFTAQFYYSWMQRFQSNLNSEAEAVSAIQTMLQSLIDERWQLANTIKAPVPAGRGLSRA